MTSYLGTLEPSQVARVAGVPLLAQRGTKLESVLKTLRSAALGEHELSPKSRRNLEAMAPVGPLILEALDGEKTALDSTGSWGGLALGLDVAPLEPYFRAPLEYLAKIQEAALRAGPLVRAGRREEAERQLRAAYGCDPGILWQGVLSSSLVAAVGPLSSALMALAVLDTEQAKFNGKDSIVFELLRPGQLPAVHWLARVRRAYRVDALDALAGRVAGLRTKRPEADVGVSLSHALLRKWSSGKQLPHPSAANSLLAGLARQDAARLRTRYALARLLTFLIAAVVAYSEPELQWDDAQAALLTRYERLYRVQGGRLA